MSNNKRFLHATRERRIAQIRMKGEEVLLSFSNEFRRLFITVMISLFRLKVLLTTRATFAWRVKWNATLSAPSTGWGTEIPSPRILPASWCLSPFSLLEPQPISCSMSNRHLRWISISGRTDFSCPSETWPIILAFRVPMNWERESPVALYSESTIRQRIYPSLLCKKLYFWPLFIAIHRLICRVQTVTEKDIPKALVCGADAFPKADFHWSFERGNRTSRGPILEFRHPISREQVSVKKAGQNVIRSAEKCQRQSRKMY